MGSVGFVLTCKMWRTQTLVCSVVWICGSIAQTDSFVFTRVIQTSIRLFTEPPRVVVVASTVVCAFPAACLTNTVPRTKPKQRRTLTKLCFNRHVEPQAELAQLHVFIMQSDEVMMTRDEPLGLNSLTFIHIVGEKKLILYLSIYGTAFKVFFWHIEQSDAIWLQCFISRHQQFVSMLQLKWAYLWEVERLSGWLLYPLRIPTLRNAPTDVSYESPIHLDCVLFKVPFKWSLSVANCLAVDHVDSHKDDNQMKQWWPHVPPLLVFNQHLSWTFRSNLCHLENGKCVVWYFMRCCSLYSKSTWRLITWEKTQDCD